MTKPIKRKKRSARKKTISPASATFVPSHVPVPPRTANVNIGLCIASALVIAALVIILH